MPELANIRFGGQLDSVSRSLISHHNRFDLGVRHSRIVSSIKAYSQSGRCQLPFDLDIEGLT